MWVATDQKYIVGPFDNSRDANEHMKRYMPAGKLRSLLAPTAHIEILAQAMAARLAAEPTEE